MSLRIEGLSKTYPSGVHALRGITLTIEPGMFGLLGPNGAGKSSLMRTITTLQPPEAGSIRFRDVDVLAEVRGRIWRRTVPRAQADDYKARYEVISARLAAGSTVLHVYAEPDPGDGFEAVDPALEDVYFRRLAAAVGGRVPAEA